MPDCRGEEMTGLLPSRDLTSGSAPGTRVTALTLLATTRRRSRKLRGDLFRDGGDMFALKPGLSEFFRAGRS